MMLKSFYNITLKDVVLLDATKSADHLKKYWFIPIFLLQTKLEKLAGQIFEAIGNSTSDELENKIEKQIAYQQLQLLDALYKLVIIELRLKTRVNIWRSIANKEFNTSPNLEKALIEVRNHTGIEIRVPEDVQQLNDYIEFRVDKYREMYPIEDTEEKKEADLMKVIYSIFRYMDEPYNENMRLITFCKMKQIAEEKMLKSQTDETTDDGND